MNDQQGDLAIDEAKTAALGARRALLVSDGLLPSLIEHFDQPALAVAMRVNISFNKLAGPLLYRTVVFDFSIPFTESVGAGMLHCSCTPVPEEDRNASFEYGKAHYFARSTEILEIVNHLGQTPRGWNCRIDSLRSMCPHLDHVRFRAPVDTLRDTYASLMDDIPGGPWNPRLVEIFPISLSTEQSRLSIIDANSYQLAIQRTHNDYLIPIDIYQSKDAVEDMYKAFIEAFGVPDTMFHDTYEDTTIHIEFVRGFGPKAVLRENLMKLAVLFFWVRQKMRVVAYVDDVSCKDLEIAERAERLFRKLVEGQGYFCPNHHPRRLEGCSFAVAPSGEIGRYRSTIRKASTNGLKDPMAHGITASMVSLII